MSSQESVRESRVSHPAPRLMTNNNVDPFGPVTEEEMEAELKRIDAMEKDQEVTYEIGEGRKGPMAINVRVSND